MKKILYRAMACGAAILSLAACDKTDENLGTGAAGNDRIILDISPKSAATRAVDPDLENRVDVLDVLIFRDTPDIPADDEVKVYHERIAVGDPVYSEGRVELKAQRSLFRVGTKYWVYLIANATQEESTEFAEMTKLTELKAMHRTDERIHITGLWSQNAEALGYTIMQNFLMDGVAFLSGETEPASPKSVVLNDGVRVNDTFLKVILRRAAVKLILEILPGPGVQFQKTGVGYYMRNMPYVTRIVADDSKKAIASEECRTTQETTTSYLQWTENLITVTMYAYSHSWDRGSALENEPRWIPNVPMIYDDPDTEAADPVTITHSYYQIPVVISQSDKGTGPEIKRNHCYRMRVQLNRPGGTSPSDPLPLEAIEYMAWQDWKNTEIPIGGSDEQLAYLAINESEMSMHNTDTDNTTLRFASSSDVTATVKEAYFIDKFGQKQSVSDDILSQIVITPDPGMTGGIKVYSPVPTNNTARYIVVEFTNNDNVSPSTVIITQYPVIDITNIQGWYSYRSDFGGTTWENYQNPTVKRVTAYGYDQATDTWQYSATDYGGNMSVWTEEFDDKGNLTRVYRSSYGEPIIFTSMVAEEVTDNNGKIKTTISRYTYYTNYDDLSWWDRQKKDWKIGNYLVKHLVGNLTNSRMYHVRVRTTSGQYTVGRPRLTDDGKTDPGADNALLVSPSFMIASQLGATPTIKDDTDLDYTIARASSHCEKYIEVTKDGTEYDNWRLPTAAEVNIIMQLQYNTADGAAMDEVMAGYQYLSASGIVYNTYKTVFKNEDEKNTFFNSGARFLRCIRDAYEEIGDNKASDTTVEQTESGKQ